MDNLNIQAARAIRWDVDGGKNASLLEALVLLRMIMKPRLEAGEQSDGVRERAGQLGITISRCAGIDQIWRSSFVGE